MIIVTGQFTIDPAERDNFLQGMVPALERTRKEGGCLEYVMGADPADPGRIVLLEKWESDEALAAHAEALKTAPRSASTARPTSMSILRYDASNERSLM